MCEKSEVMEETKMTKDQLAFLLYCVDNLAEDLNKDQTAVYDMLKESGVADEYILPSFDVLHTQGRDYIMDDIKGVLKKRGAI